MSLFRHFSKLGKSILFLSLSILFIGICISLSGYLGNLLGIGNDFTSFFARVTFFKLFYLELLIIVILMACCRLKVRIIRTICFVLAIFCTTLWIIQLTVLWYSDDFVTLFLLENVESIALVLNKTSVLYLSGLVGITLACLFFVNFLIKRITVPALVSNLVLLVIAVVTVIVVDNNLYDLPNKEIAKKLKINRKSPVVSFVSMVNDFRDIAALGEVDYAVKKILRMNANPDFPMLNDSIYESQFPFSLKNNEEFYKTAPNVIVFFVEALSARKLSPYKESFADDAPSAREGLTPNIEHFSQKSMTVDHYFSHTYSTFRGLRGQNCSMFPYYGGAGAWALPTFNPPEGPYECLPHHLTRSGYQTIFFGPDYANHCKFSFQTKQMGFERNIYKKEIEKKYLKRRGIERKHLTDHELMLSLIKFLKEVDSNPGEKPFYLASYPKGSHVGLDYEKDGKAYENGMNRVYNTTRSWDEAFGYFWTEFKKLDMSKETIFILTGDHSHWPERAYIEIAGSDFDRRAFDKLGLFINSPFHDLPARYDANNATSLGFAPMIAQIVGISRHSQNSFLGKSPFDTKKNNVGIGWANNTLFLVDKGGKSHYFNLQEDQNVQIRNLWYAIGLTHAAELNGKMVEPDEKLAMGK